MLQDSKPEGRLDNNSKSSIPFGTLLLKRLSIILILLIANIAQQKWELLPGFSASSDPLPNASKSEQKSASEPSVSVTAALNPDAAPSPAPTSAPVTAASTEWVKVNTNTGVRQDPDASKPIILDAVAGETFPVLKKQNNWIQIQLNHNQSGWMPVKSAANVSVPDNQSQVIRMKSDAALFWGPEEDLGEAKTVAAGTEFVPEQVSGKWIRFSIDGKALWGKADQAVWSFGAQENRAEPVTALSSVGANKKLPLSGKTIVIDPGHGGDDPGAIAKNSVYERDVNLSVALVLAEKLKASGAKVLMTRTTNDKSVSLEQRVKLSNDNHADAFISIHQNMYSEDPTVFGTITYYDSAVSKPLANDIETDVTRELKSKEDNKHTENEQLYVLKHNTRPAVLVEGCFLSNPKELTESLTTDYQEQLAKGIFEGILSFFKVSNKN